MTDLHHKEPKLKILHITLGQLVYKEQIYSLFKGQMHYIHNMRFCSCDILQTFKSPGLEVKSFFLIFWVFPFSIINSISACPLPYTLLSNSVRPGRSEKPALGPVLMRSFKLTITNLDEMNEVLWTLPDPAAFTVFTLAWDPPLLYYNLLSMFKHCSRSFLFLIDCFFCQF